MPMPRKSSQAAREGEGKKLQEAFLTRLIPEDSLGRLFDLLPNVYFFVKDTEGHFMRMNQALLQAIGFSDETAVLGFTDADFFSPFFAHGYREEDRWIVSKNRPRLSRWWR